MQKTTYNKLFVEPFDEAQSIDKSVLDLLFNSTSLRLLDYLRENNCNYLYTDDFILMQLIHKFTLKDKKEEDININAAKKIENIRDIKFVNNKKHNISKMIIERENQNIEIMSFSKLCPEVLEIIPSLDTVAREGECFNNCITIASKCQMKGRLVTGYIYGTTDKSKFLHTWIETKLDGKEVVIDLTFNAVFNKEGFYALTKAKKKEEFKIKEFKSDANNYLINLNGCVDTLPLETYLYFRDEIVSDFKKNKKLFLHK